MSIENWEEISREKVFEKYGRAIEKKMFRLTDGREVDFYLNSGNGSVACLALTQEKEVILVRQFRPGPKKILLEIPGGGLKKDESPGQAMERELLEETGYRGDMQFVTSVLPS
ncbi:MAG: NUDIX hydrolase, partial [Pyrinomonadaceae bacterium]